MLVNNAGVAVVKPFGEITSIEWDQTVGVNITAPFMLTQHFAPKMPPGASIVNILSVAYALARPAEVALENISLSNLTGNL